MNRSTQKDKKLTPLRLLKALWIFIPLVLAALMYFLLPMFPEFTEYVVSRGLFRVFTVPVGFITSLLPISLTELLVILAVPAVVALIALFIVRMKKSSIKKKTALKAGRFLAGSLSFALFIYMTAHGANFYRLSMEQLMGLDTSPRSTEFLLAVCKDLAAHAAAERELLAEDENGCVQFTEDIYTELTRTGSGYDALTEEYPFLWTSVSRQKPVMLSYYWSYTGIVGMYFPFFAECNVNIEQPDFAIPFTASHESAHSRGIAQENECNFLAFLSCISSEYPEFRYSGYMEAFKHCSNSLYSADRDLWQETYACTTEGMRRDFTAENEYIHAFEGEVKQVSSSVNDGFIKAQGVSDGTRSYSRVTDLILAWYEKALS
ncbi:MAG: DUF3810 domain-containing protein [Oscillospiraceae bacterium]